MLPGFANCFIWFLNFLSSMGSRHADGISRYSIPASAGPLLLLLFSALMLLVGGRNGNRPVKNCVVGAGMVICLGWGADLHMAQLIPLPLTVSCFNKIQIIPFWYWLTLVVPDKETGVVVVYWYCCFGELWFRWTIWIIYCLQMVQSHVIEVYRRTFRHIYVYFWLWQLCRYGKVTEFYLSGKWRLCS